jgi:hypothetical protein
MLKNEYPLQPGTLMARLVREMQNEVNTMILGGRGRYQGFPCDRNSLFSRLIKLNMTCGKTQATGRNHCSGDG